MPPGTPNRESTTSIGNLTHAATSKTTPVDLDEIPIADSAASNILKKLTWANLKATLKTYFDTLYAAVGSGITNSAGANVVMKSDGTNAVASRITDDATNIVANSEAGSFSAGDTGGDFTGTSFVVDNATESIKLKASSVQFLSTMDDGAIPTINTTLGIVRIASGTSSITVTSSAVTTNSNIQATPRTVDTTLKSVVAVPGSGSFVITGNAVATADVDIQLIITNPIA